MIPNIPSEINNQHAIVNYLSEKAKLEYDELQYMVIERCNELFVDIKNKVPNIKMIPLFCTHYDDYGYGYKYEDVYNHEESIIEFKSYALDNNYLTQRELDSIEFELLELYYLADVLIYNIELDSSYNTSSTVYHSIIGKSYFEEIETLMDCFNE